MIDNTMFKKKDIHKYTWMKQDGGRIVDRAMMDYVVISRDMVGRLLDVRVEACLIRLDVLKKF